ncbi:MAG: hypothetical protein KAQ93_05465 [Spirochaetales bacterium]|nr:hypothetical protein [Spirochaetales bacterium]
MSHENMTGINQILPLVNISKVAILLQLFVIPATIIIVVLLGEPPQSALEAFEMMKENQILGLIRDDLYNILMISLYLFSFSGLFFVLRRHNFSLTFLATLFTFTAVVFALSSHSGFSLLHLSRQYWSASDESLRSSFIAAGETIISLNMWNSSSGYFAGIFLQGGGILMSIAMIGSKDFSKLTIISGITANGLDLIQHLIHPFLPNVSEYFMYGMGPFYLIWFFMLFKNLNRYIKLNKKED